MSPADFTITRPLRPGPMGQRWLALHKQRNTSHTLHRPNLDPAHLAPAHLAPAHLTPAHQPTTYHRALARLQALTHPHILAVQAFGVDADGPWAATDYTGDADGIVTLDSLLTAKGASLSLEEARRTLEQLLDAARAAHRAGLAHATLTMDQVHVERNGALRIEFYALRRLLAAAAFAPHQLDTPIETTAPTHSTAYLAAHSPASASATTAAAALAADQREEVRSALRIAYQLVTGLAPIEPLIPVEEMVEHIDESWPALFETGLGPTGFTSAAHAWSAAHACRIGRERPWAIGPARYLLTPRPRA